MTLPVSSPFLAPKKMMTAQGAVEVMKGVLVSTGSASVKKASWETNAS